MFSYFTRNFITFHVDTFEFILVNYIKKLKKIKLLLISYIRYSLFFITFFIYYDPCYEIILIY